jgi:hypothetical protein
MSSPTQPKADQLAAALAPHLGLAPTRTLKGVAKSLRRLAKQLINQQDKQEKAAAKAALPTAKKQRNTLAGELLTALHPHLGLGPATGNEVPKKVIKTVKQLAAQLLKQRTELTRQAAKSARKAAKKHLPAATPARSHRATRPQPMTAARRPATAKVVGATRVARTAAVAQDGVAK